MAYLITFTDKDNSLDLRLVTREKHIRYLSSFKDNIILAGPILDKENNPKGTVLVLNYKTFAQVQNFIDKDPYSQVKLFKNVKIIKFKQVI
tara:strand:- start:11 stop:283 length:273 start_codon:yes stop_codon:yes gene_type:complete